MSLPAETPPSSRRAGAAGVAYDWLRAEILSSRMRPGHSLSEADVAQRLGVSRTPVREAIIRLESEGLLWVRPQVGTSVAPIDVEDVADGQFVREAIECHTVTLAAQRPSAADARELRSLLRAQEKAAARRDHAAFVPLDDRMHQHLAAMGGRPRVWRTIEAVKAQLDRVRFLSLEDPVWLETIHAQHVEIVERVLAQDAQGAAHAMSAHLRAVFQSIATIARTSPAYFRNVPGVEETVPPPSARVAGYASAPRSRTT